MEVIEHLEMDDATKLMQTVLDFPRVNSIIVTTPNFSFNVHYSPINKRKSEFRHSDHKFELTFTEFEGFISKLVGSRFHAKFLQIGDSVDGGPVTLGAYITPREDQA